MKWSNFSICLTLKGYCHTFTLKEYLEIMQRDTIDIWSKHNDSTKTKVVFKFLMKKYSPPTGLVVDENVNHISTSYKELFQSTDLEELYSEKKASLLSSFSKVELNGSGWVLDKILKFIVKINHYSPLLNVNSEPQAALNINDDDRVGGCFFDMGDFLRNKKVIIVPQNNKGNPYCLLWQGRIQGSFLNFQKLLEICGQQLFE